MILMLSTEVIRSDIDRGSDLGLVGDMALLSEMCP